MILIDWHTRPPHLGAADRKTGQEIHPAASSARNLAGRPRRASSRGQSLAETALAAPVLLVFCLGIADGGRAYGYREAVVNADRALMRVTATQQSVGDAACSGTGVSTSTKTQSAHIPWQTGDTLPSWVEQAAEVESKDGSGNSRLSGSSIVTVTFHCLSGKAITNTTATTNDPASSASDSIEVNVCYQFSFLTPLVGNLYGSRHCTGMSGSNVVTITEDAYGRAQY